MKLKYRIVGEGRPVMIFHGLFGMSDNWQSFAKKLADVGYQVVLGDLRNHGHSPHSEVHNYTAIAADIAELISDLNLIHPDVIGHSMGGKSTLQLINDFPGLVRKAVVVDIAPYQYPVHHREILDALLSVDLEIVKRRGEAEKILTDKIDDFGTRQFLLKNLYWETPDQLAWRFNLKGLNRDIDEVGEPTWPSLQNDTPVLFVRGEMSGYVEESRFNEILQWYPNAEFATIEGAGHWVHADKPDELLHTIEDFLM
ncbi:MAG TPA: alpha/beta fold hydrolase [Bacteroidia bacterium]|nr:alpha/beta fold hydrolase [Bacteroidia bacterium]HQF28172.1 alpha/beta fold hydrolase [Bacteroidia bacterium]